MNEDIGIIIIILQVLGFVVLIIGSLKGYETIVSGIIMLLLVNMMAGLKLLTNNKESSKNILNEQNDKRI